MLIRKTFPGPPGYESVRDGDRPETYWLLDLPQPICLNVDKYNPDVNFAQQNVRRVQLVLDPSFYKRYKDLVGKRVVATGTMFAGHTGHHHTAALLTVSGLTRAK
jgi:hypothetical protein